MASDPDDPKARSETPAERADRNFNELLQELRVSQTGVQILFAFLLTISFQTRFREVERFAEVVYVCALLFCATATAMLIAPVALHRRVFARGRKPQVVTISALLAQLGLFFLFLSISSSLLFVLYFVLGPVWAWVLTGLAALLFVVVWYVLPTVVRRSAGP